MECEGVVGVEMLVVTVRATFCVEMGRMITAVFGHGESWICLEDVGY